MRNYIVKNICTGKTLKRFYTMIEAVNYVSKWYYTNNKVRIYLNNRQIS